MAHAAESQASEADCMSANSPWLKLFREQRSSDKRRKAVTKQQIELAELDIEIAHLEALLELRNEQRRELVNYLGLNKDQASER